MKIIINKNQLNLLSNEFSFQENKFIENKNIICESGMKEYLVKIAIGSSYCKMRIFSFSKSAARNIASKLFKGARVTAEVKAI